MVDVEEICHADGISTVEPEVRRLGLLNLQVLILQGEYLFLREME
jgi:hypothetical protein